MVPHPLHATRCLNSLLRYELAAARCYEFAAESMSGDDSEREEFLSIGGEHRGAAERLRECVTAKGLQPSSDPGLWSVLLTLVETSAAVFGRRAMLTVLLWTEQHAAETYESARRIPELSRDEQACLTRDYLAQVRRHISTLEALNERSSQRSPHWEDDPCAELASHGQRGESLPRKG